MEKRDYTIHLERVFRGPMDLLLHLVREHEVEIHEIEISRILDDYLAYIRALERLDIELAGDFLVMAATLMAIKSRSLLPTEEVNLEDDLDPRDELIQQLLEYRRFKSSAEDLENRYKERSAQASRGYREKAPKVEREFEIGDLTVWDLFATFSRLMRETLADRRHVVISDPRPLRFYVDGVVSRLRSLKQVSLRSLMTMFDKVAPKEALIGSFCALLELVRLELIQISKPEDGTDDIHIVINPEHNEDLEDRVEGSVMDDDELKSGGHEAGDETSLEPESSPSEQPAD